MHERNTSTHAHAHTDTHTHTETAEREEEVKTGWEQSSLRADELWDTNRAPATLPHEKLMPLLVVGHQLLAACWPLNLLLELHGVHRNTTASTPTTQKKKGGGGEGTEPRNEMCSQSKGKKK